VLQSARFQLTWRIVRSLGDSGAFCLCTDLSPGIEAFTDGLWHSVSIDVVSTQSQTHGKVNVTVDGRPDISHRHLAFTAGGDYFIGGISVFCRDCFEENIGDQFWHYLRSMRSRVYATVERLSVCSTVPSFPSTHRCCRFAAERLVDRRYWSVAGRRHSTVLISKCGQFHIGSDVGNRTQTCFGLWL